jgi:hypothetical protein
MEASEAQRTLLASCTPDEIARKHWVHGHLTLTRRALPRPFTQEITGSNPVGGTHYYNYGVGNALEITEVLEFVYKVSDGLFGEPCAGGDLGDPRALVTQMLEDHHLPRGCPGTPPEGNNGHPREDRTGTWEGRQSPLEPHAGNGDRPPEHALASGGHRHSERWRSRRLLAAEYRTGTDQAPTIDLVASRLHRQRAEGGSYED